MVLAEWGRERSRDCGERRMEVVHKSLVREDGVKGLSGDEDWGCYGGGCGSHWRGGKGLLVCVWGRERKEREGGQGR